jgi:hypothetical protein
VHLEVLCFCWKAWKKWTESQQVQRSKWGVLFVFEWRRITSKSGKDQGGTTDHPWGLRRKVRTSCEKTPYLDRGDVDLKMTQIKGAKSKMPRWVVGRKTGPNQPRKGLGGPAHSDRPIDFLWRFGPPFDLAPSRSICSSLIRRPPHTIILPMPFTRKPSSQDEGESWMSSLQESTPAEGRKQMEDSKSLAYGCSQASSPPSSSRTFAGVSITPMCFNPCNMMG